MPLLTGKLRVTCPKTNSEVEVKSKCTECDSFKHISWQGLTPLVSCNYGPLAKEEPQ